MVYFRFIWYVDLEISGNIEISVRCLCVESEEGKHNPPIKLLIGFKHLQRRPNFMDPDILDLLLGMSTTPRVSLGQLFRKAHYLWKIKKLKLG